MKEPAEACASAASEFAYAFDRLETRHHLLDRNLRFHAGQRISRASVNAAAECQVPVGISPDVEAVRIRKLGRIAVGGANAQMHVGFGGKRLAADLRLAGGATVTELIGTLHPQEFFDRGPDEL